MVVKKKSASASASVEKSVEKAKHATNVKVEVATTVKETKEAASKEAVVKNAEDGKSVAAVHEVENEAEKELANACIDMSSKMSALCAQTMSLKNEFKALERRWAKELRSLQRVNAKRKVRTQRQPSGFVKPAAISDELADFLQKAKGSEMARTDVTREINAYIRLNSLQDSENGRKINADPKLKQLLKLTSEDVLTYFNLQKYMSPHFYKMPAKTA